MDIDKRIIVLALMKVDRIEDPDIIAFTEQEVPAGQQDLPLRIRDNIGAVCLKKV